MKRYAKLLQMDERGQLVIPKDVRDELRLETGAGFSLYVLDAEGIVLVPVENKDLRDHPRIVRELEENAEKISVGKVALNKAKERYVSKANGKFTEV
jgi:AbrB family looped-hinge helix DNA binding protein